MLNLVRHAEDLGLTCVPVDNLVEATEEVMHDPLPPVTLSGATPKYSNAVSSYIDDFARREQTEATGGLVFAPKEADLGKYPSASPRSGRRSTPTTTRRSRPTARGRSTWLTGFSPAPTG